MPLHFFYTMVQKKSKMTKNSNQGGGGSCLMSVAFFLSGLYYPGHKKSSKPRYVWDTERGFDFT